MGKKKCPECIQKVPGWLVQFADLMSLLLVFFVLLLSMAVMDKQKVEEYFQIMKKSMGFLDSTTDVREQTDMYSNKQSEDSSSDTLDGSESPTNEAANEIEEVMRQVNESINEESSQMELERGKNEFTLDIPSNLMFDGNEYALNNEESKKFIAKIARIIRTMPQTFQIEIAGHTDRSPFVSNEIPRDNWDVSALRSISVVKELIKNKIDPALMKVAAHGQYKPKSDRAIENRRVEIKFYAQQNQSDVFSQENFFDRLEE